MVSLILIGIIVVVLLIILKTKAFQFSAITYIFLGLFLFFLFTYSSAISNSGLDFKSIGGILGSVKIYFLWLKQIVVNVAGITGNALKMDWAANFTK